VAFEDDRDERASVPDRRHRCYAESRPAPRALAHQEAYCLASAFPICPTFQDWARREAARTRADSPTTAGMPIPGLSDERPTADLDDDEEPPYEDRPRRSNQRDWAAPPPWLNEPGSAGAGDAEDAEDAGASGAGAAAAAGAAAGGAAAAAAGGAAAGAGLSGSFADRLVTPGEPPARQRTPVWRDGDTWDDEAHGEAAAPELEEAAVSDDSAVVAAASASAAAARAEIEDAPPRRSRERSQGPGPGHDVGPSWERPARLETFPSLRSQRMPSINLPTLAVAAIAIVLAAILLFFLPSLLGIGSNQAGASPSPSVAASAAAASIAPTPVPEATQQTYTVQSGDTMSKIAKKFGVPLQTLIDANKTAIPNPDKLKLGQVVIIPGATPSTIPAASP
jgi:hypothetical protein